LPVRFASAMAGSPHARGAPRRVAGLSVIEEILD
jgi:hypothetical protein